MNTEVWKEAFETKVTEIVDLTAYKDLLNEPRHHEFTEMTIHSMFGSFKCNCNSRSRKQKYVHINISITRFARQGFARTPK